MDFNDHCEKIASILETDPKFNEFQRQIKPFEKMYPEQNHAWRAAHVIAGIVQSSRMRPEANEGYEFFLRRVLAGKKIIELGSRFGLALYALKKWGAQVQGIESDAHVVRTVHRLRILTEKELQQGWAGQIKKEPGSEAPEYVFSMNFFSKEYNHPDLDQGEMQNEMEKTVKQMHELSDGHTTHVHCVVSSRMRFDPEKHGFGKPDIIKNKEIRTYVFAKK